MLIGLTVFFFLIFVGFEAAKLGIPPPPPYLSLSKNDDALLTGVNYASGGAGILNDTGLYFVCFFLCRRIYFSVNFLPELTPIALYLLDIHLSFPLSMLISVLQIQRLSFDDQIDCFKKTKESITTKIGEDAANKLCNEAMYFIGIGRLVLTSKCICNSATSDVPRINHYLLATLQAAMTMLTIICSHF
jgi:hypothetical protein